MKTWIKSSLIFLGGFASGVATAYLVATHFLDIEFVEEDSKKTDDDVSDIKPKPDEQEKSSNSDPFKETYKSVEDNDHYVDYSKLLAKAKFNTDPESDDIYDNVIPDDVDIFGDPIEIKLITDKEFGNDPDYDEIDLRYYENQQLLTDDWDVPVENIEGTVGKEAMDKLHEGNSDVVYVRNHRLKADYEIACYSEDYPGISG